MTLLSSLINYCKENKAEVVNYEAADKAALLRLFNGEIIAVKYVMDGWVQVQ